MRAGPLAPNRSHAFQLGVAAGVQPLPPPSVCGAARTVLKRWLRDEGETELVPASRDEPHARWTPSLDAELILAVQAFKGRLRKKSGLLLTKARDT